MNEIRFSAIPLQNPLYKEVKRQIMAELISGEWKPGTAIPAEKRLSERFGVSIGTVRKAIDELVAENILIRQQGRGTYVATHDRDRLLFYFFHIVGHDGAREYPVVTLQGFARARAEAAEAAALGVARGAPVFRIRNLLRLSSDPVMIDDIVIDQRRFSGLTEKQFAGRPNTIYNLYQTDHGITVLRARERARATAASRETARILGVPVGMPVLEVHRIALTFGDKPVEYRVSIINTATHDYVSLLSKRS
jgi:GntR family transcriptional regulator